MESNKEYVFEVPSPGGHLLLHEASKANSHVSKTFLTVTVCMPLYGRQQPTGIK